MKHLKSALLLSFSLVIQSCANAPAPGTSDPFQWLEEVEGAPALKWVNEHNQVSLARFKSDPRYPKVHDELKTISFAKDRIPSIDIRNGKVFNFWQDEHYVQGVWRTTSLASYQTKNPKWTILLDFDAMSKKDKVQWVFKGSQCLMPAAERCLISLSRGGKDAVETREFDVPSKSFVKNGFFAPENKSHIGWKDQDTLWLATNFGPGSMTTSGYPRIVKLWRRGTPITSAHQVFEGKDTDVSVDGFTLTDPEGSIHLVSRGTSFFEAEYHLLSEDDKLTRIPVPSTASFEGAFDGEIYFSLKQKWDVDGEHFPVGAVIAVSQKGFHPRLVMEKPANGHIQNIFFTRTKVFIETLENIQSELYELEGGKFQKRTMPFSGKVFHVMSASRWSDEWVVQAEHFLLPVTQYLVDGAASAKVLKQMPARFKSEPYEAVQKFATSKDGTQVPFFLVYPKGMKFDGTHATLLNAYGGFEVDHLPAYSGGIGKVWLDRGGVYVRASIRGGGEFGPEWHSLAVKQNRQKVFDDFFAVAEELIRLKVTSPQHLGIIGGSNGGLLMGVALTQRPELFNAIVCQVPLLDMIRYSHLLAGASWMDEYGNPDVPAERKVIEKYSPYQNLDASKTYPETYFSTSTKDDRVHPGHARKMVAKLESMHKPVLYFENTVGGHGGGANIEDHVNRWSYEYIYLMQKLMGNP